jgi:hypothetical protein
MKLSYFILGVAILPSSCAYNDSNSSDTISCSGVEISFAGDVLPLITTSCATNTTCHATGSHEGPGALTNYTQVNAAGADISAAVASGDMPKNSSLTASERNTIICWVRNGGLNN